MANLQGNTEIIERINWRVKNGVMPYEDEIHISNAYDGGGLSVISNVAAARVMADTGRLQHFESIATISAAYFAGAAAMSGQSLVAKEIFIRYLHQNEFIKYRRALHKEQPPIINLEVVEDYFTRIYPLDTKAIKSSKTKLILGLTNMVDFSPTTIVMQDIEEDDMKDYAMHGIHLPLGAGPPKVHSSGLVLADGGLVFPDTATVGFMNGADEVIEHSNAKHKLWRNNLMSKIGASSVGLWMQRHVESGNGYKAYQQYIRKQTNSMNNRPDNVVRVHPENNWGKLPGTLCRDPNLISYGWDVGEQTTLAMLGYDTEKFTPSPVARRSLQRFFGKGEPSRAIFPLSS